MIVELVGGPLDGDRAQVPEDTRRIVLHKFVPAVFTQPLGPVNPDLPDAEIVVGEYRRGPDDALTFTWALE